jgi:hypothetical protein
MGAREIETTRVDEAGLAVGTVGTPASLLLLDIMLALETLGTPLQRRLVVRIERVYSCGLGDLRLFRFFVGWMLSFMTGNAVSICNGRS